jgi:hypothetical protein
VFQAFKGGALGELAKSVRLFARPSVAVLATLLAWTAPAGAQTIREDYPLPNGLVYSLAEAGGTLYVGGSFTRIGPRAPYGVVLSPFTGEIVQLPKLDGSLGPACSDGQGGWYIMGGFQNVNGVPRNGMAHLQADGTVAAWNPQRGPNPLTIALGSSAVYIGGIFTVMNGVTRIKAAAVDPVTAALLPWDPHIDYVSSNDVETIRVAGGRVYLGGDFYILGGSSRHEVAAVHPVTGALFPWNPIVDGPVFAIAVGDSAVYLGGRFTHVGGSPRTNLAAVDIVTGAVKPWNPGANGDVWTLERSGSTLYAGGLFSTVAGASRSCVAAFDLATGSLTPWNPGVTPGPVWALAPLGPTIYVGGQFSAVGGQARDNIAAIDSASGAPTPWDPGAYATVYNLVADGATVLAGGPFASISATRRHNLAAVDIATRAITDWNPGANGIVRALVTGDGPIVYAGGAFDSVGGERRKQIAAIVGASGVVTDWNPSSYGTVYSLALRGSLLYAGGNFSAIGGQPRSRIAAVDLATGLATPWNPGADNTVRAIVPHGDAVFAGGSFQNIGGASRPYLAALDPATGAATAWSAAVAGIDPDVYALAARGPTLYVGGDFLQIGGAPRVCLAALDTASGAATSWVPGGSTTCYSLALAGVRASGAPEIVYAGRADGVEVLDGESAAHMSWYPAGFGPAYALEIGGPNIFAGGAFGLAAAPDLATSTLAAPPGAGSADHDLIHVGPVPSAGRTAIGFVLARDCHVRLRVFDVQGRVEAELVDAVLGSGILQVVWNGEGPRGKSPAGNYFVRLEADGRSLVKRIVLAR